MNLTNRQRKMLEEALKSMKESGLQGEVLYQELIILHQNLAELYRRDTQLNPPTPAIKDCERIVEFLTQAGTLQEAEKKMKEKLD